MKRYDKVMMLKKEKFNIKDLWTPANLLSLLRIPLAIIMVVFYQNKIVFIILLTLAMVTDMIDGYLARLTRPTAFGAFLDPLCDKIFFAILLIFLVIASGLPIWQLLLLLMRDIFTVITVVTFAFHHKNDMLKQKMKARWFGKMTTISLFVAILWLALGMGQFEYVVYAVALLSAAAIIDYTVVIKRCLAEK